MSALARLLADGIVAANVELAPLTTYKFGGKARWYCEAGDAGTVEEAVAAATDDGVPLLVLGRGSNLVVSDSGFSGLVLQLTGELASVDIDESGTVTAGAAVPLPRLARSCARSGRGGLEFLVAVPGSIGGAVRMNAGCHGSEMGEWLISITVYRPGSGLIVVDRDQMEMSYRHNSLPEDDVVLQAKLRTEPRRREDSEALMREITQWRRENQPGGTFNAGSVFKNPPGTSAGFLIDSAGLKGFAVGGAKVSQRHANFFEAVPGARAQDLYDLVWEVQRRVRVATGIDLEPEIRFVGTFDTSRGPDRITASIDEVVPATSNQGRSDTDDDD